jgi:predicted dehydrogenase
MISLALIGCGEVAETGHLPTILGHGAFRLAAVCDVDRQRAALFSKLAGGVAARQRAAAQRRRPRSAAGSEPRHRRRSARAQACRAR